MGVTVGAVLVTTVDDGDWLKCVTDVEDGHPSVKISVFVGGDVDSPSFSGDDGISVVLGYDTVAVPVDVVSVEVSVGGDVVVVGVCVDDVSISVMIFVVDGG